MHLSRQEVDLGKGYLKVKDAAGTHDWEDTWDGYRAAHLTEKSVSSQRDLLCLLQSPMVKGVNKQVGISSTTGDLHIA